MKNNIKTLVLVFAFSIFSVTTFAANSSGEEDLSTFADNPAGAPGDPGAPINDYLVPMLLIGVIGGFYWLRKKAVLK